jgi:hypothetical protein
MSLFPIDHDLNKLDARLDAAPALTAQLLSEVAAACCPRIALLRHTERAAHAEQMIERGAWTDATLALLALELPLWQLRRLVYDSGEWYCALSRQRETPEWLDQAVEAHHADLPMAILRALVGARQASEPAMRSSVPASPRVPGEPYVPVLCDNFT